MKNLLLLPVLLTLTLVPYAESNWAVTDDARLHTTGETVFGHKFGFIKKSGNCDIDLLYIGWSTYQEGLEKHEGEDALIELDIDGNKGNILIPLVSTYNLAGISTLAIFTNFIVTEYFINLITESNKLKLTFKSPEEMLNKLDIQTESFNLSGFTDAYQQAYKQCK
jgi:hypothetical protein